MPAADAMVAPEQIPTGFQFVSMIASEGVNLVYKARNQTLDQIVAIKILRAESASEERTKAILDEARLIANLDHAAIAKLLNVGTLASGAPYLVYEFVEGETLRSLLINGPLELGQAENILLQLLHGLEYIHSSNLLHRDIKPENVMLPPGGGLKILDFGIARKFDEATGTYKTAALDNSIKGTPFYMSPEQCERKPLTAASDIYSFGCVLYECIDGRAPFRGESLMETIYKHTKEAVPELKDLRAGPEFQEKMQQLVRKVLAKEPSVRPSAVECAEELRLTMAARSAGDSSGKAFSEHTAPGMKVVLASIFAVLLIAALASFAIKTWQRQSQSTSKAISDIDQSTEKQKVFDRQLALSTPKSVRARLIRLANDYQVWMRTGHKPKGKEREYLEGTLDTLLKEAERDTDLYAIRIWYGRILRNQSRFDEAIPHFRAALEFCKDKNGKKCLQAAQCYLQLSDNYLMKGDYPHAIENALKAEKIHREFDEDDSRFYLLAVPATYKALEPRGFMVRIQDALGSTYYKMGEWQKAREHFELARAQWAEAVWAKNDECVQFVEGKVRLLDVIYRLDGRAAALKFMREWEGAAQTYADTLSSVRYRYNNLYTVQGNILAWCEEHKDMRAESEGLKLRMKKTRSESEFDKSMLEQSKGPKVDQE